MPQFTPPLNRKEIIFNETPSSTMTRKEKDAERKRRQRASETPEKGEKRNEKKRVYARRKRSSESSDASLERLYKQQMIDKTRRNNETTDERTVRLRSDSERRRRRTMEKRSNPRKAPWLTSISQKVKENCLSEFNKKMSMDSLREQVCIVCNSRHNEKTMHKMLLSNINENLLKPHQSLHETIFDTPPAYSQDADFDEESISLDESSGSQKYLMCS